MLVKWFMVGSLVVVGTEGTLSSFYCSGRAALKRWMIQISHVRTYVRSGAGGGYVHSGAQ